MTLYAGGIQSIVGSGQTFLLVLAVSLNRVRTMYYLEQPIELIEQGPGWIGVWWHPAGCIQVGFFPTAMAAWEAVVELIQRSIAVQALLELVEDWRETAVITDWEYIASFEALMESVLVENQG